MRVFILLAKKAITSSQFSMETLYEAGRMDVVVNTIANTLFVSHKIRENTKIYVVLNGPPHPPKTISFEGSKLVNFAPTEKSIVHSLKKALSSKQEKEVISGVSIAKKSFERLLREIAKDTSKENLYYLKEDGLDIIEENISEDSVFIIGDAEGISKKTENFILRIGAKKLSLGPTLLFSSQCPVIIHNVLDRKLKKEYSI